MKRRRSGAAVLAVALVVALLAGTLPVRAVQPDEILPDRALESRARSLSAELRCLVCQNQSIDDSDAPLARDLRLLVRDRLKAGDSDVAVRDYVVARYGDFVLLRPPFAGHTLLLWLGPAVVVVATGIGLGLVRRTHAARSPDALTGEEESRLRAVLDERS